MRLGQRVWSSTSRGCLARAIFHPPLHFSTYFDIFSYKQLTGVLALTKSLFHCVFAQPCGIASQVLLCDPD